MVLLICLIAILVLGVACVSIVGFRVRRLTSQSCSALIRGMQYVDMKEICAIARAVEMTSDSDDPSLETYIERLGGLDGLLRIHHNAGAMMDIARYLILMNPEAYNFAQEVRKDAVKVRRTAKLLYWRHRLHLDDVNTPISMRALARRYVSVSVNMMTVCRSLVEEVMPLLQEVSNVQARMNRTLTSNA